MKLLVEGVRSGPSVGSSSTQGGFSKLSHIRNALCSACAIRSIFPQSRGVKHLDCSHPQKARMPVSWSSVGMTTSRSAMQLRNTSLPICVSRGGSQMCVMATHWVKVDLRRAVISAHMRLTSTSRLPRREIADRAFHAAPMLRHVEIAAGIQHVGFAAWQGCQQLQIVKLPPSVLS